MQTLMKQIQEYRPYNEQEMRDQKNMLTFLRTAETPFLRDNELCHMTASGWIVNPDRTKVLMVYHNIYHSWSWTGGHADGETDLMAVAIREAKEETGIEEVRCADDGIFSLETITVDGHVKKGKYVASHLHMNVTYLLEASEEDILKVKPDENSGVRWLPVEELENYVSEPWMMERVYRKLITKSER